MSGRRPSPAATHQPASRAALPVAPGVSNLRRELLAVRLVRPPSGRRPSGSSPRVRRADATALLAALIAGTGHDLLRGRLRCRSESSSTSSRSSARCGSTTRQGGPPPAPGATFGLAAIVRLKIRFRAQLVVWIFLRARRTSRGRGTSELARAAVRTRWLALPIALINATTSPSEGPGARQLAGRCELLDRQPPGANGQTGDRAGHAPGLVGRLRD
jgi:hypothetical protein